MKQKNNKKYCHVCEKNIKELRTIALIAIILSLIYLFILVPKPTYSYRTEHVILDNSNLYEDWNVVNYVCDEGVYVNKVGPFFKGIYASTWEHDSNKNKIGVSYGECMFKIKKFEGWK